MNILTVLNTENALFRAEDPLVQVKFSHLQALVDAVHRRSAAAGRKA